MKTILFVKKFVAIILGTIVVSGVNAQKTTEINYITSPITIDGNGNELFWENAIAHPCSITDFSNDMYIDPVDSTDYTGTWKGGWNDTALFMLFEVNDSEVIPHESWTADLVELYFQFGDGELVAPNIWGAQDSGYFMIVSNLVNPLIELSSDDESVKGANAYQLTDDGYTMEIYLSWEVFNYNAGQEIIPSPGVSFNFDPNILDNDNNPSDEGYSDSLTRAAWSSSLHLFLDDWSMVGHVNLTYDSNTEINDSIIIDGEIDPSWETSPRYPIAKDSTGNMISTNPGESYFKARWDQENLYILGVVNDDVLIGMDTIEGEVIGDNIMVYLDPGNYKSLEDSAFMILNGFFMNDNALQVSPGQENLVPYHEYSSSASGTGYIIEFRVPVDSTLEIITGPYSMLGLDIQLNDIDINAKGPYHSLTWNGVNDTIWPLAASFGTIKLLGDGNIEGFGSIEPPTNFMASYNGSDVVFSWSPVIGASGYYIYEKTSGGNFILLDSITNGDVEKSTITNVLPGSYQYFITSSSMGDVRSPMVPAILQVLENDNNIYAFNFKNISEVLTTIDSSTIEIIVPANTDLVSLSPFIKIQSGTTVSPKSGVPQDFSNPVTYEVTAANGQKKVYVITVIKKVAAIQKTALIEKINEPMTIDGIGNEPFWEGKKKYHCRNFIAYNNKYPENSHDLSGFWKGGWNDTALILYVEVNDDVFKPFEGFVSDMAELFFRFGNKPLKSPNIYSESENGYYFLNGDLGIEPMFIGTDVPEFKGHRAYKKTDNGWSMELRLLWDSFYDNDEIPVDPVCGFTFGFGLDIQDIDVSRPDGDLSDLKYSKACWSSRSFLFYNDWSTVGNIKLADNECGLDQTYGETEIFGFEFLNIKEQSVDIRNDSVLIVVADSVNAVSLVPVVQIANNATINTGINPNGDFQSPITYQVTGEDGNKKDWVIKVSKDKNIGIKEAIVNHDIKIFPNPAASIINIRAEGIISCKLFSMAGNVYDINLAKKNSSRLELDVSTLIPGVYIIQLNTRRKNYVQSIVIE